MALVDADNLSDDSPRMGKKFTSFKSYVMSAPVALASISECSLGSSRLYF